MPRRFAWIALALLCGCQPQSCSDAGERRIEQEVRFLVTEPGRLSDTAENALVARGDRAIAWVETGLYEANEWGRQRVVRVLERIGTAEALPIIEFLANSDRSAEVRERATRALDKLRGAGAPGTSGQPPDSVE